MKLKSVSAALAFLACSCPPILAAPSGTAFTYQGKLTDSGQPANGIYDLRFTIYDALANGQVVGGPLTNTATSLFNGLFTLTLDFGSGLFAGDARWLEIAVRCPSGSGGYASTGLRRFGTTIRCSNDIRRRARAWRRRELIGRGRWWRRIPGRLARRWARGAVAHPLESARPLAHAIADAPGRRRAVAHPPPRAVVEPDPDLPPALLAPALAHRRAGGRAQACGSRARRAER